MRCYDLDRLVRWKLGCRAVLMGEVEPLLELDCLEPNHLLAGTSTSCRLVPILGLLLAELWPETS